MTEIVCVGVDVSVNRVGLGALTMRELPDGRKSITPAVCEAWAVNLSREEWTHRRMLHDFSGALLEAGIFCPIDVVTIEKPALPHLSGTDAAFMAGRAVQVAWTVTQLLGWPPPELIQPADWKHRAGTTRYRTCNLQDVRNATDEVSPGAPIPSSSDVKADVYMRALKLGFLPHGKQDAADAALIALAGGMRYFDNPTEGGTTR